MQDTQAATKEAVATGKPLDSHSGSHHLVLLWCPVVPRGHFLMCRAHPTLGDSMKAMPRLPRDLTSLAFSARHPEANQAQCSLNPVRTAGIWVFCGRRQGPSGAGNDDTGSRQ